MKKISSTFKENYSFVTRPFALVNHEHVQYFRIDSVVPVVISTPIVFTGPVSGIDTAGTDVFVTAGEAISALRILSNNTLDEGIYADPSDTESIRKIIGMSISAGGSGSQIKMLNSGKHIDGNWSFDVNLPIFLGENGTITQVAPVTGSSVVLGHASAPNTIFLDIKRPIILI